MTTNSYTADTCTTCDAPIGYQGPPQAFPVCRECRAWECEYECPYCPRCPSSDEYAIHAHLAPCEHGVQPHHCILPDPNQPWPLST